MKKVILLFAAAALLSSAAVDISPKKSFRKLKMLQGTWKMETRRGAIYEEWKAGTAAEINGRSYTVKGADTMLLEAVVLRYNAKGVFYIPTVRNQNGQQPVTFRMTADSAGQFIFENPQHDFPKRIVYHFVQKDSVHAWIDDGMPGTKKRSDFYYKRIQ